MGYVPAVYRSQVPGLPEPKVFCVAQLVGGKVAPSKLSTNGKEVIDGSAIVLKLHTGQLEALPIVL